MCMPLWSGGGDVYVTMIELQAFCVGSSVRIRIVRARAFLNILIPAHTLTAAHAL